MDKFSFGAIRWDAWYTHDGVKDSVISQVERSLSPSEFHFRAPFFAEITDEGKIIIPEYSQEIFDKEMEYAMDAGIDYFAYVWYGQEGLCEARKFHTQSKYRDEVKMCACLDGNAIDREFAHNELPDLFAQSFYKKVLGGRPLIFFFGYCKHFEGMRRDMEFYTAECEKRNIPKPFFAMMDIFTAEETTIIDIDAVSHYCEGGSDGISFEGLHSSAVERWHREGAMFREAGKDYIPTATSGWNNQPRHKNPVGWIKGDLSRSYAQYAQEGDIFKQVSAVKEFLEEFRSPVNSAIIYAWNEHDEGGWICPTLKVDENGNQLYGENGEKLIDDWRIKEVKKALKG